MATAADTDVPGLRYSCRQYGSHDLQRVGIWQAESQELQPSALWIVYIHGGAWRAPSILHETFVPSIKAITSSSEIPKSAIRGFISIDYRLSPHPSFPQDPDATPSTQLRCARHPDHILDVFSAFRFLADEYQLSNDYVLVGHSAGATLAYQLLMGDHVLAETQPPQVPLPKAIIGISGIFYLVGLVVRRGEQYAAFVTGAFGQDRGDWDRASPVCFPQSFNDNWECFHLLAWSPEDTLIDEPEINLMTSKLAKDRAQLAVYKDLTGEHDFVWEDGSQVARLVSLTLQRFQTKEK